jgi:hypothetical protein
MCGHLTSTILDRNVDESQPLTATESARPTCDYCYASVPAGATQLLSNTRSVCLAIRS